MKTYFDYTSQEIDEIYAKLSLVAQDFVYSDIISEEVAAIGKETGLAIDKWQDLNTLVLETVLGMTPSADFKVQVDERITRDSAVVEQIVAHMENEIFSVIREESIESYEEENNNKNIGGGDALYDTGISSVTSDPYREATASHGATVISQEKLHLVDELFAPYDRAATKKNSLSQATLSSDDPIPPPDPIIITKETLAKLEGRVYTANSSQANQTASPKAEVVAETNTTKLETLQAIPSGYDLVIEKGSLPLTMKITFVAKKKTASLATSSAAAPVARAPASSLDAATYKKDPYRELM